MASDAVIIHQQQPDAEGSLAQLFASADSAIERRRYLLSGQQQRHSAVGAAKDSTDRCLLVCRTENIFKQLDERSLTADEENIIQQRVCEPHCLTLHT